MPDPDQSVFFRRAGLLRERSEVRGFHATLRRDVADGRNFHCLFAGDAELRRLNAQFLGHDYPTDVLSFPSQQRPARARRQVGNLPHFLGEIAISVERAAAQAGEYGHTLFDEIRTLMLHGLLHLIGMDHETDGGRMRRAEKRWRSRLGLPQGLIERTSR